MSTKLDISENISSYKQDSNRDLVTIEFELNTIPFTLNSITKPTINKIENLFIDCENNVNIEYLISTDKTY